MQSVLIDTDPGTDDVLAIIMALNSPDLDVVGITTVGGNAKLTHTTSTALRLLASLRRPDIPIAKGASSPLDGKFVYAYQYHGRDGLSIQLPTTHLKPRTESAYDLIVSSAKQHGNNLVVIALGPLTNIAQAILKEPRISNWLKEIVIMGGAVNVGGNITPHSEFNIYNDPKAASIVFTSGVPIKLIGLDVTQQTYVLRKQLPWVDSRSNSSQIASKILSQWFEAHTNEDRYCLHDPLAVAASIQPDILTYRQAEIRVDTNNQQLRGKTTAIYDIGSVKFATRVNFIRSTELILETLQIVPEYLTKCGSV